MDIHMLFKLINHSGQLWW